MGDICVFDMVVFEGKNTPRLRARVRSTYIDLEVVSLRNRPYSVKREKVFGGNDYLCETRRKQYGDKRIISS